MNLNKQLIIVISCLFSKFYYYNDNTTDIDALSSYCVKLSEQCNKKKLPKLEKKIDKFYDILQSIKSDSNK